MNKIISLLISAWVTIMCFSITALAQVAPVLAPAPAPAPDASADFFSKLMSTIQGFGGLSTLAKVTAVIVLLIASVKVSFLNQLVWSKLGAYQSLIAPLLSVVAGVLGLFGGGAHVSPISVLAYLSAGVGAVGLHELLDDIKALPGVGPAWVSAISVIESALGGASQPKS